jgi:hypothetical protein
MKGNIESFHTRNDTIAQTLIMTGKRKPEIQVITRSDEGRWSDNAQNEALDAFRQHFESQFEPLHDASVHTIHFSEIGDNVETSSDATSISDWEGFLDEESTPTVEIIKHEEEKDLAHANDDLEHAKAFMVG